jgi:Fe-S cluster assembly scaffold protein SufB
LTEYKDFVNESIRQYDSLPQEGSELYKRYYINIPFDLKNFQDNAELPNDGLLGSTVDEWLSKLNMKFDLAIGSHEFLMPKPNEFIKVENPSGELYDKGMHKSSEDKYVAYINAYSNRSVIIDIPEGKVANINMLMLNTNMPLNARIFIRVGKEAQLNLFEYYGSSADKHTVLGTIHEIELASDAAVEVNALHNENSNTLCLTFSKNTIGENAHFRLNSVYNGAAHTRVRNTIEANSTKSKVDVNELIFGSFSQKFDISTRIVNAAPHTNASLESKAALMDESFCIMKGFAKINKGAEKARSYVHERGILLDKGARVNGLPDMSVDENDVKATHSSATSPVDPESVFYLMTKGIDSAGVRKLLVTGFFADSLSKIHNLQMKELSMSLINSKLENKKYGITPKMDVRNIWIGSVGHEETDMFKGHYKYRGVE